MPFGMGYPRNELEALMALAESDPLFLELIGGMDRVEVRPDAPAQYLPGANQPASEVFGDPRLMAFTQAQEIMPVTPEPQNELEALTAMSGGAAAPPPMEMAMGMPGQNLPVPDLPFSDPVKTRQLEEDLTVAMNNRMQLLDAARQLGDSSAFMRLAATTPDLREAQSYMNEGVSIENLKLAQQRADAEIEGKSIEAEGKVEAARQKAKADAAKEEKKQQRMAEREMNREVMKFARQDIEYPDPKDPMGIRKLKRKPTKQEVDDYRSQFSQTAGQGGAPIGQAPAPYQFKRDLPGVASLEIMINQGASPEQVMQHISRLRPEARVNAENSYREYVKSQTAPVQPEAPPIKQGGPAVVSGRKPDFSPQTAAALQAIGISPRDKGKWDVGVEILENLIRIPTMTPLLGRAISGGSSMIGEALGGPLGKDIGGEIGSELSKVVSSPMSLLGQAFSPTGRTTPEQAQAAVPQAPQQLVSSKMKLVDQLLAQKKTPAEIEQMINAIPAESDRIALLEYLRSKQSGR